MCLFNKESGWKRTTRVLGWAISTIELRGCFETVVFGVGVPERLDVGELHHTREDAMSAHERITRLVEKMLDAERDAELERGVKGAA